MDPNARLAGNLIIEKLDDGSGGNLSVEGILSCGQVEGLSFVTTMAGDGITTDFFIPHDLESLSLVSAIYDREGQQIDALVTCVSLNNLVVQFGTPPEADTEFKIVLMK